MPNKKPRLLRYISARFYAQLGLIDQVEHVLNACIAEGTVISFDRFDLNARIDTQVFISLAYRICYTEAKYFTLIVRRPHEYMPSEGISLGQQTERESILMVAASCADMELKMKIAEAVEYHFHLEDLQRFCIFFEYVFKRFSILVKKKNKANTSESMYYTLEKKDKKCKIRLSCHPRIGVGLTTFDFDFVVARDSPRKLFEQLMDFFVLSKLSKVYRDICFYKLPNLEEQPQKKAS